MAKEPPEGHYIQTKAPEFEDAGEAGVEESLLTEPYHMVQQDRGIDHEKDYGRYYGPFLLVPQGQSEQQSRDHGDGEIDDLEVNGRGIGRWFQP